MAFKFVTASFACLLFVKVVSANCINSGIILTPSCGTGYSGSLGCGGSGSLGYGGSGSLGCGGSGSAINIASGFGGSSSFPVVINSAYSPSGISVVSENHIDGDIGVSGALPFASAVAFESAVPSGGEASANYGCGSGVSLNSAGSKAGYASGSAAYGSGPVGFGSGSIGFGSGSVGIGSGLIGLGSGIGCGIGSQTLSTPVIGSTCGCGGIGSYSY